MLARASHCASSENMNRRIKMSLGLKALQHQAKQFWRSASVVLMTMAKLLGHDRWASKTIKLITCNSWHNKILFSAVKRSKYYTIRYVNNPDIPHTFRVKIFRT
ncbi:hypothetical protein BHE74_00000912 [Ensete ventricosum]|uniref:Uncharacterized protein n=1 Tax=Ensete ventricosum TaxID=4639 RepID=A0A444EZ80_ENSVE|nr:hypothetical protein GW17_00020526 [Ensete ventricosum]RWW89981.1 hypothetical protein BHE74_00000912 [Ensete ventricosum]RZR71418.1 hypothetical protein BHM03_00004984 [Ensete ventricosum]